MIEVLKLIRIKQMCEDTGLNYRRIRNYTCGAVKKLDAEEIATIKEYIEKLAEEVK